MIDENITLISKGAKVKGKLSFPGSIKIDGKVTGDIKSEGTLTISEGAKVDSIVQTKNAIISGDFKGKMHVSGRI